MSATRPEPEASPSASPIEPPADRPARLIFSVGMIAMLGVLAARRLDDFDLAWHVATGERILATRSLPTVDDLSFTGGTIKYLEPVSDVLYATLLRFTGAFGLQLAGALVCVATLVVLAWQGRDRGPVAYVAVALTACAAYPYLFVRPAATSVLFLVITLAILDTHRRDPDSATHQRALYALPPLALVWANTHGFAPFCAYLAVLYAGYRATARLVDGRVGAWLPRGDGGDLARVVAVAIATIVATTFNRGGARLLLGRSRFDEDFSDLTEWTPTTLSVLRLTSPVMFVVVALAVAAIVFGRDPITRKRAPSLWEVGVVAIALGLTFRAIRFVPVGAVLIAPVVADRLAWVVRPTRRLSIVCALSIFSAPILAAITLAPELGVGWYPAWFPEGAVGYIEQARPAGAMWNFMPFGGYLELRLYPRYRAFNDGRNALVRDASIVTRARMSMFDDAVFDGLVRDASMEWAVACTMPGHRFNVPLATKVGWRMVFRDEVAAIYVREAGPNAALATDGYRVLNHLTTPQELYAALGTLNPIDVAHDGARAMEQAPTSPRGLLFGLIGAFAVRDRDAFDSAAAKLEALAPNDGDVADLRARWSEPRAK